MTVNTGYATHEAKAAVEAEAQAAADDAELAELVAAEEAEAAKPKKSKKGGFDADQPHAVMYGLPGVKFVQKGVNYDGQGKIVKG